MPVTQWCWRCQSNVPMLTDAEWDVLLHARDAGDRWPAILDGVGADDVGHPIRRPTELSLLGMRNAWWQQGYRFFTGREESDAAVVLHHRTAVHGPPCAACGQPLRTPLADACVACGYRRPGKRAAAPSHPACALRLRPDRSPTNVSEALRVPDDEFLHALVDVLIPDRLRDAGAEHLPEGIRMAEGISRLWMLTETEGSVNYLGNSTPSELADAIGWCEELGAHRCAEYLRGLDTLFPEATKANDAAWEARLRELADTDEAPLDGIDRRYCDVIPRLPGQMRAFVMIHRTEFEDAAAAFDIATATGLQGTGTGHFPGAFDYIQHSLTLAEAMERRHPSARRAGQVIALATPAGARYFQVILDHALQSAIGYVARTLSSHAGGSGVDATALAQASGGDLLLVDASVFALPDAIVLGTVPVASSVVTFRYPMGEDAAGVRWWGVWRGGTTTVDRWPEPLSPAQVAVPVLDTLSIGRLHGRA